METTTINRTIAGLGIAASLVAGSLTPFLDGETSEMSPNEYFSLVAMYNAEITPDRPLNVENPKSGMDIIKAANARILQVPITGTVQMGEKVYTAEEFTAFRQSLVTKSETPKKISLVELLTE